MTLDEFRQSLTATEPPAGYTKALAGLWCDAKGNWKRAHECAQQDERVEGSWVHAYLHRKEGDPVTPPIRTTGQVSPSAGSRTMRNGSASSKVCLNNPLDHGRKRPDVVWVGWRVSEAREAFVTSLAMECWSRWAVFVNFRLATLERHSSGTIDSVTQKDFQVCGVCGLPDAELV
jgi:hypothetical protein